MFLLVFISSCSEKFYSVQDAYVKKFTATTCTDSTVFYNPCFTTMGFDFKEMDTITIITYKKNGRFDTPIDSSTYHLVIDDVLRPSDYSYYNGHWIDTALFLNREADRFVKSVVGYKKSTPCSVDMVVKLGNKYRYTIANMESREMYINGKKDITACGIYAYELNGVKVHYHNFLLIKPGVKIRKRAKHSYYVNKKGLFINRSYTDSAYFANMQHYAMYDSW